MHKRYIVKLDEEERKQLAELVKKEKVAAKKRTHAQVLLLADCGGHGPAWKDEAIAEACGSRFTVENLRKRLVSKAWMQLNRKPKRVSRGRRSDGEKRQSHCACAAAAPFSGHAC
jgi:hypothetical protein